jgi:predicted tellurium resistance membrane protein TerC
MGIDNIVFISILSDKLPPEQRVKARFVGLGLALVMRVLFLFSLTWLMKLEQPLFTIAGNAFSGRDLVLIGGGLFLMGKATFEIHHKLEVASKPTLKRVSLSLSGRLWCRLCSSIWSSRSIRSSRQWGWHASCG